MWRKQTKRVAACLPIAVPAVVLVDGTGPVYKLAVSRLVQFNSAAAKIMANTAAADLCLSSIGRATDLVLLTPMTSVEQLDLFAI